MSQHREAAVAESAGEGGDARHLVHEYPRGAGRLDDASGERLRIAPVPGEVEGHRGVAIAREGERERLHQLLRSGEAVGDDDHGTDPGLGRAENADRCPFDVDGRHTDARPGRVEPQDRDGDPDDAGSTQIKRRARLPAPPCRARVETRGRSSAIGRWGPVGSRRWDGPRSGPAGIDALVPGILVRRRGAQKASPGASRA